MREKLTVEERPLITGKLHDDNAHVHRVNVGQPWTKQTRSSMLIDKPPQCPDLNPTKLL